MLRAAAPETPETPDMEVTAPETTAPGPGARAAGSVRAGLSGLDHRVREARRVRSARIAAPELRRRTDLRLVPAALLVWATAVVASLLEPQAIAGLCAGLAAAALVLLAPARRCRKPAGRSLRATAAAALLVSCAAAAHAAVASVQRHAGAVAEAVSAGATVVAEIDVAGVPRRLAVPARSGAPARWAVPDDGRPQGGRGGRVGGRNPGRVFGSGPNAGGGRLGTYPGRPAQRLQRR